METYEISAAADARAFEPIMLGLHELLNRLPVTARSLERRGLRIENGGVVDADYSGPVLEEVLAANETRRVTPSTGTYRGTPVVVTPVRDSAGRAIAAIGVVDVTGLFELADLMDHQWAINREVCGTDTCPVEGPRGTPGT
ncbi:MAG: DUF2111 domain-containing protein [Methanospirillum sp.]|nr:DUF2111 domain-containing protein [Methanospirillum sp.]